MPKQGTSGSGWGDVFTAEEREIYDLYRRPERPDFQWPASALLVIDVTKEFIGRRAPTIEAARQIRTACGLPGWDALGPIRSLIDAFHSANRPVFYTKGYRGERFGGAAIGETDDRVDSRIADEIAPTPVDTVIEKPRASAFFGTPLASLLIRAGVRGLVVVGATTSGCVRASTLDASSLGFGVVIADDGCFDRSQLSHSVALYELDVKYATVLNAATVVTALDTSSASAA